MKQIYVTWEELLDAYEDCILHKKKSESFLKFHINKYKNLYQLWLDLNNGKYLIGPSITFVVHFPKDREVFAADFRDRIVHHLVIRHLDSYLENYFIEDSFSCRKNKGTLYGIKSYLKQLAMATNNFTKKVYILLGDLSNFFCSINKTILIERLEKFFSQNEIPNSVFYLNLCKQIINDNPEKHCILKLSKENWKNLKAEKSLFCCEDNKGLPVGNLTSQKFAALYLTPMDYFILSQFQFYGRYVDDFFIIDEDLEKLKNFVIILQNWIRENLDIDLSVPKTKIKSSEDTVQFIGAAIRKNRTHILKRTIHNFKNKVLDYKLLYLKNELTIFDAYDLFVISNCYIGMCLPHNSYRLRKKLMKSDLFKWASLFMNPSPDFSKFVFSEVFKQYLDPTYNYKNKTLDNDNDMSLFLDSPM